MAPGGRTDYRTVRAFRFGTLQIMANLFGALICTFYFVFLDQPSLAPTFDAQLVVAVIMTLVLTFIGIQVATLWSRDISRAGGSILAGETVEPDLLALVQRKVLNAPLFYSGITFFNWSAASLIMGVYSLIHPLGEPTFSQAAYQAFRLWLGVLVSGMATAGIVFFQMDRLFRKVRPLFFPDGGMLDVKGAFRLQIRQRLIISFLMVSLWPLVVGSMVAYHKIQTGAMAEAEIAATGLLNALGLVGMAMILIILVISRLSAQSIAEPIREMESAMARVHEGDLSASVLVTDNDELGGLAEAFNHMVDGLKERDRMRQSLNLAMEVQRNLLPRAAPRFAGLDVAGVSLYCDETGGDYYDYLDLSRTDPGAFGVAVGDVSDHGVPSALLMATARAYLRQRIDFPGNPGQVLTDLNRRLCRDVEESGRFMTLFLCRIDPGKGRLLWANAGHDPGVVHVAGRGAFRELEGRGPALGLVNGYEYPVFEAPFPFQIGDVLVIGTDGLWEALNPAGSTFGKDRFRDAIRRAADYSAQGVLDNILDTLRRFTHPEPFRDDVTLVVVKAV